jgi:FkbM family methyltransferase
MQIPGGRRAIYHLLQEFERDTYGIRNIPSGSIRTFIDLGANCGLVSLLIRCYHPKARIIALEPNPDTYKMLAENLKNLGAETHNMALANGEPVSMVRVSTTLGQRWDVGESAPKVTVPSIKLSTLMKQQEVLTKNKEGLLMLKVDVEGSEIHLMEDSELESLRAFDIFVAELHGNRTATTLAQFNVWLDRVFRDTHYIKNCGISRRLMIVQVTRTGLSFGEK